MEKPVQSVTGNIVAWLLLEYLCLNPQAKDTVDGIAQWWLRRSGVDVNHAGVEQALRHLVSRGWLTMGVSMAGSQTYGLNQTRKTELQQLFARRE